MRTTDCQTGLGSSWPKCHRPFTKQIVKREAAKDYTHEAEHFSGTRNRPYSVDVSKEFVEFVHYCKCRHCGYEWTETKTVKFEV
ncbi:MAG TPA: hypothetical protein VEJ19_07340 [Nitrososphaerales archaeon]|nr:hypothetical protein [Nitrososphaerales archaeon]